MSVYNETKAALVPLMNDAFAMPGTQRVWFTSTEAFQCMVNCVSWNFAHAQNIKNN